MALASGELWPRSSAVGNGPTPMRARAMWSQVVNKAAGTFGAPPSNDLSKLISELLALFTEAPACYSSAMVSTRRF